MSCTATTKHEQFDAKALDLGDAANSARDTIPEHEHNNTNNGEPLDVKTPAVGNAHQRCSRHQPKT